MDDDEIDRHLADFAAFMSWMRIISAVITTAILLAVTIVIAACVYESFSV